MREVNNLLGVVLSGGESRRMGRDKGLILSANGRPWALIMGDKLRNCGLPVVYSINKTQLPAYSVLFPAESLVVDAEEQQGPLNGLFSVHLRFPGLDLLLLACDMQDLDAATLEKLITAWRTEPAAGYAFETEGVLQPFCAIYGAQLLARGNVSMSGNGPQALLRTGTVRRLQGRVGAFRNYNTI